MTLYMIGLGLDTEQDITIKGLHAIEHCKKVYLESYTSMLNIDVKRLESLYQKEIIVADRELIEQRADDTILFDAQHVDTAFLVVGDVFGATTHTDLYLRAQEQGIRIHVIHNTSIINAVSDTGLELYKFGKTTSIPYPSESFKPTTAYDVLEKNQELGVHTLMLLDIKKKEERYMSVNEAIEILFSIEKEKKKKVFTKETFCIGCARIGSDSAIIKSGTAKELLEIDFGNPLHCLIVPGKLHFMEEEMLDVWNKKFKEQE